VVLAFYCLRSSLRGRVAELVFISHQSLISAYTHYHAHPHHHHIKSPSSNNMINLATNICNYGDSEKMVLIPNGFESKIEVDNKAYNLFIQPSNIHDFNLSFLQFLRYVAHFYSLFASQIKHPNLPLPSRLFVVEGNDVAVVSGLKF
jgi:hypothetical protein